MSQSVIGALRVNLGLDSAQFERGAGRARNRLREMRGQFKAVASAAGALGIALGAVTRQVVASANEIQNFARVADAAPETFQKWSAAASTVGVEQEKLADQLKDVKDRVGDFLSTGGGPMADFFENIAPQVGVTAEQFRNLSGPQALQLYVDSLEKADVGQAKMTFYLEAMASDLTTLLPLLRNGGAEMDRIGGRAEEFGAVLDGKTLQAMRRTQIALAEVGLVFKGFAYQIATAAAPALEAMANAFTDLATEGRPLNVAFTALADNLGRLTTYVATAVAAFGTRYVVAFTAARLATLTLSGSLVLLRANLMRTGVGLLIVGVGELIYQFTKLAGKVGSVGETFGLLKDVAAEAFGRIGDGVTYIDQSVAAMSYSIRAWFLKALGGMAADFVRFTQSVADGLNGMFGTNLSGADATITQDLQVAWLEARSAADAAGAAASAAGDRFSAPLKSLEALRDAMKGTAEDTSDAADAAERFEEALGGGGTDGGGEDGGGAGKAAKKAKKKLTELEQKVKSTAETIRGSFTDAFKGVITGAQGLRDGVAGVLSSLADIALTNVGNALFSGISKSLGAALTPGAGTIPGFGAGTNSAPGGLAWVGEQGRELVNLPRGAQVIPNHRIGESGGAGRVEVVPSPYFDVHVTELSRQAAAPMVGGAARQGRAAHGARSMQYQTRGTMT